MNGNTLKTASIPPMKSAQKLIGAAQLGYNALHYAAFNGHKDVIQELLNAGADVNAVTTDNYSAFMLATLGGFTEVVEMLLQTTQPDLSVTTKDESQPHNGLTCLHLAVMSGNNDLVFMLLSHGANAKAVTNMGYSVLHLAAELGYTPILSTLLSESQSIERFQRTSLGNTALHLAVASGVRKSVAKLLQHSKADIDVPDQDGYTALHMAVSYQLPYIVELLLENGANVNTQSTLGQTPIMEAVLQGENVMVEMLTRHRADVTIPDHTGTTPLIAAAAAGDEENVRSILNHYSNVVASAVYADSDPESIDIVYRIDIHSVEHIAQLCDHQNKEGHSAMSIATKLGYENIIRRLMLAGARNITDPCVPSNVTQEDCAAVMNNIKSTGTDTPHRTSSFQDLHPSPAVFFSSTGRSTTSTDSGDDGSSIHSDGILSDIEANNLSSDRFSDLHAPSLIVADLSSSSMIAASGTTGKTIRTATKDTLFKSPERNFAASSSDRFADLRPPPDASPIREVLPVPNCPDSDNTSTIEYTKKTAEIHSDDEEWFVIPFDVSAYPVDDRTKVREPLPHEAQIVPETPSSHKSPENAAIPLISEQIKRMLIRIRKSAARQQRRKEMRTARRAALNLLGVESHPTITSSEIIALKEALKQQTARVDQLAAQLESLQDTVMSHFKDEDIEWDQEIEFARNLERQERFTSNVGGVISNNTAQKTTAVLSKFVLFVLEGLSIALILVALALLVFIRVRLLH
eukprot:gene8141-9696_t